MKKNRKTKHALLSSILSLLLCFSMLIGTTFAWFTDTVTSGNNLIQSGNLDMELEYYDGDSWEPVTTTTNLFKEGALWEPGHTEVVYLKVRNAGSLAMKYHLGIEIDSETQGTNVDGKLFKLSDYIEYSVIPGFGNYGDDRDEALKAVAEADNSELISKLYSKSSKLYPKDSALGNVSEECVTLVVYMPKSVENVANHKTGTTAPTINLGVKVFATQLEAESDSFGTDYDKNAPWAGEIGTVPNAVNGVITITRPADLAALAKSVNAGNNYAGITIQLGADIDLNEIPWTPIGAKKAEFSGRFDGNGYTITNLKVSGTEGVGLIGYAGNAAHIEDVRIINARVSGTHYVGTVLGYGYLAADCLKNCYVKNATVICTPVLQSNGKFDDGNQAGVIAGMAINGAIVGNKAVESTVTGYRDIGGIVGCASAENRDIVVEGNEVSDVELYRIGVIGIYPDKDSNVGSIVGRVNNHAGNVVHVKTNSGEAKIAKNPGAIMIYTAEDLFELAASVNAGNTYAGKMVLLGADIDLNGAAWTPIGNSTYSFQGTFDGMNHTISNLSVIMPGKSNVGLFGMTTVGEIKNLTVKNADVEGYLNVGVVAGTPYTSKYTNITVTGHVEVNGFAYVGGVGGKNVYADWTNITVDVDETSYVNAVSTANGISYRTYVGGVIGFMGEDGHKVKNVTSNIDVIGDVCDVGGIVGIAHYGNIFENITCSGDVTLTLFDPQDPECALEIGGIAGVWHNGGAPVTMENVKYTGKLKTSDENAVLHNDGLVGKPYSDSGTGKLYLNGSWIVLTKVESLKSAIENAQDGDKIVVGAGSVTLPTDVLAGKEITIAGTKDTKIDTVGGGNYVALNGASVTFEGVTIQGKSSDQYNGFAHAGAMNYVNCTFEGTFTVYSESVFTNCTFNLPKGCYVWTSWGSPETTFEKCVFNTAGKALLVYHENGSGTVNVKNCTFNATAPDKAGAINNQYCAAIEIDNSGKGVGTNTACNFVVNTSGNTYDSNFSGEWRIKTIDTTGSIKVNDVSYTQLAIDGKLMTIDSSKNVTVLD